MKLALMLSFLLVSVVNGQSPKESDEDSLVKVLSFRYSSASKATAAKNGADPAPASALIPEDKNFRRNARQLEPHKALDPNVNSTDGRSAAIEKNVNEARAGGPIRKEGYSYQAKIRNDHSEKIEVIFWEYVATERADPSRVSRQQFLCGIDLKPGKEMEMTVFSTLAIAPVVDAGKTGTSNYLESVQINRVEFANGSILQRKDWDHKAITASLERALATPWKNEMCRPL